MKVLALGGCGDMGRYAVKTLVESNVCEQLVVADIDGKRAASFAEQMGGRVKHMALDVLDSKSLEKAVKESDAVMSTVGPFFRFGPTVLSTCIRTGRHYFDICDDWEPTLSMLELDRDARSSKITAIIGMGASPGISSLLAKKAILELDSADEVFTGWDLDSTKPEKIGAKPSAATVHGIHQLTGRIRTFENGKYVESKPISPVDLEYPGIGVRRAYTIGHPEAVTFPRYYPTLKTSLNVMTTTRTNLWGIKAIAWLVDRKIISVETAARFAERVEGPADPENTPDKMLSQRANAGKPGLPPLFALAVGTKAGKPARSACAVISAPAGGMGGATGVPLAVGVRMLAQGKISGYGVFAPEGIINPDSFFDVLAPFCSPKKNNSQTLVLTTRSWEDTAADFWSMA